MKHTDTQPSGSTANRAATKVLVRHVNTTCVILFALLGPPSLFMDGFSGLPFLLLVTALVAMIRSKMAHLQASLLSLSIIVGVACVSMAGALGYRLNGTHIFSGGEMAAAAGYGVTRSIGAGFFAPFDSLPTLFGYSCNAGYGPECSNGLLWSVDLGAIILLGSSVIVGNVLVYRRVATSEANQLRTSEES